MVRRLSGISLMVIGVVFGIGASAQHAVEDCVGATARPAKGAALWSSCERTPTYAKELFGVDGDKVVLEYPTATTFNISNTKIPAVSLLNKSSIKIDNGQTMDLTFRLHGAAFATSAGINDLSAHSSIKAVRKSGGARGDKSVTYELTGSIDNNNLNFLSFRVPPLWMAASAMTNTTNPGVLMQVELTPTSRGSGKGFPHSTVTYDHDSSSLTPAVEENGTVYILRGAQQAVGLTVAPGPGARINLDQRSMLAGDHARTQQMNIGDVTLAGAATAPVLADGETPFSVAARGGAGSLTVSVAGDIRQDDVVFLDYMSDSSGRSGTIQAGEALTMGDDGKMELTLDLEDIFVDADNNRSTPPVAPTGTMNLYYKPNGKDALWAGSFLTTFAVEYSRSTNLNPTPMTAAGPALSPLETELTYQGAPAVKAYAIAPHLAGGDMTDVRIRCDGASECQVYLACHGADGTAYFGKLPTKIAARGVRTVPTMEIADVIGADAGVDFAGRMSCQVIGDRAVSVQVLTNSGGTTVNNTFVAQDF